MPVIPAPRFKSSRCFLHGASGERNANCSHHLKVANPARLVPLPPIEGVRLAAGGAKRPPQQVQGRSPWRAFGDFPRDGKVTRVPSMAKPCSRGAPASRVECRGGPQPSSHIVGRRGPRPCPSSPGGTQYPLHLYPETNKKLHPNVQLRATKKRGFSPRFFCCQITAC